MLVKTHDLEIETFVEGPAGAPTVLLVHGWPDDATTWIPIARTLNVGGLRTIRYMHRGCGGTRFRSATAERTGNIGIIALDALELLDALDVETCFVAGHDWGVSVAETLAVGWPRRFPRIALMSSPSRLGGMRTPPFPQAQRYWYHWLQCTRRGVEAVAADPIGFARIMWDTWSPPGWFDEETFASVSASFCNDDWTAVTTHSYRSRWNEAAPDPRSIDLERKVYETESIKTPTLFFQGDADGVTIPDSTKDMASKFTGVFQRIVLEGVGHFPTRECPEVIAERLLAHFG